MKKVSELGKELINKLPKNWDEVTVPQYRKMIKLDYDLNDVKAKLHYYSHLISIFGGIPIKKVKELPLEESLYLMKTLNSFLSEPIPVDRTMFKEYKLKSINKFSYDDWCMIQSIPTNDWLSDQNAITFLRLFNKWDKEEKEYVSLEVDDIDTIPITVLNTAFFLVLKSCKKSIIPFLLRRTLMEILSNLKKKLLNKLKRRKD